MMDWIFLHNWVVVVLVGLVFLLWYYADEDTRVGQIIRLTLCWFTLSYKLPEKAKEYGLLKKWQGWILTLVSPAALITFYIIYLCATIDTQLPVKKLDFSTREEIATLGELDRFPEFKYHSNSHNRWNGNTFVRYSFKNENEVKALLDELEWREELDSNFFWRKAIATSKEDLAFFGDSVVYVLERGWHNGYMKSPKDMGDEGLVNVTVGKNGFVYNSKIGFICPSFEDYCNRDSMNKITGVSFPKFRFVNYGFEDMWNDMGWGIIFWFDKLPSKEFVESLRKSPDWVEQDDGRYRLHVADRKGQLWEEIIVDPRSRKGEIVINTY